MAIPTCEYCGYEGIDLDAVTDGLAKIKEAFDYFEEARVGGFDMAIPLLDKNNLTFGENGTLEDSLTQLSKNMNEISSTNDGFANAVSSRAYSQYQEFKNHCAECKRKHDEEEAKKKK